jgi:hypothetical protein
MLVDGGGKGVIYITHCVLVVLSVNCDAVNCDSVNCNSVNCDAVNCDAVMPSNCINVLSHTSTNNITHCIKPANGNFIKGPSYISTPLVPYPPP